MKVQPDIFDKINMLSKNSDRPLKNRAKIRILSKISGNIFIRPHPSAPELTLNFKPQNIIFEPNACVNNFLQEFLLQSYQLKAKEDEISIRYYLDLLICHVI